MYNGKVNELWFSVVLAVMWRLHFPIERSQDGLFLQRIQGFLQIILHLGLTKSQRILGLRQLSYGWFTTIKMNGSINVRHGRID